MLATTLVAATAGCDQIAAGGGAGGGRDRAALQRVLTRQAAAVREGSEKRFMAGVDPRAHDFRSDRREVFDNLRRLPLSQWTYRVTDVRRTAPSGGKAPRDEARVRLRYRIGGQDRSPATATERYAFVRRSGHWYLSDRLHGSDPQLWDQGPVTVVRGAHSLVLGAGRGTEARRRYFSLAHTADGAVASVSRMWPRGWPHQVVLEVPGSVKKMARLLGAPESSYQDIAAVTTGEAGKDTSAPADRVTVNPDAYRTLSGDGRHVVLTHETVHVATRTVTGPATPLWFSEGLADWVGYRDTAHTPRQIAPELGRAVREGKAPQELPTDRDFRFQNDAEALARAYEGGWLACRFVDRRWGEAKLLALYRSVGAADKSGKGGSAGAVDRAMRKVLGVSRAQFTAVWRDEVRREVG